MFPLQFPPTAQPLRVLALGAHADDIEIGAGATLLQLQRSRPVIVRAVVFSASGTRRAEAQRSAEMLFGDAADWSIDVLDFGENVFPDQSAAIKSAIGELRSFEPDLVLSHRIADRHQDHRTIGELTWQAFRDHLILQYEIPKWEGDLATPDCYVPVDASILDQKIAIIEEAFQSQADKPWFDADTFRGLARLRGLECGQRWAEGFHANKFVLDFEANPSN